MKYMLDTNIIIYLINHRPESASVLKKFTQHKPEELCVSAITMAELEYGIYKSERKNQNQLALILFLSRIKILPFDSKAATEYGIIRADLSKKGQPIGANDLFIAAHAKAENLTLVTNNIREFQRIQDLKLANWT